MLVRFQQLQATTRDGTGRWRVIYEQGDESAATMATRMRLWRSMVASSCIPAIGWAVLIGSAPTASAEGCPPGHLTNPYNGQCYVVGSAPTIAGIPCVASHLGECLSFTQNLPLPRLPRPRVG